MPDTGGEVTQRASNATGKLQSSKFSPRHWLGTRSEITCARRGGKGEKGRKGRVGEAVKTAQNSIMQPRINSGRNLQELGAGQRRDSRLCLRTKCLFGDPGEMLGYSGLMCFPWNHFTNWSHDETICTNCSYKTLALLKTRKNKF